MNDILTTQEQSMVRNIDTWIARLQSGKLKQARGVLRKRNGAMCCLGVAAEVLREQGHARRCFSSGERIYRYDNSDASLKKHELFGLCSQSGKPNQKSRQRYREYGTRESLASLNDSGEFVWLGRLRYVDFAYIAERLLLDLRTGDLSYFTDAARRAWLAYHGFAQENTNG